MRRNPFARSRLAVLLIVASLGGIPAVGNADQVDPRLDTLFGDLRAVTDPARAVEIEKQILDIWTESGDEDVDALMELAVTSMMLGRLGVAGDTLDDIVNRAPAFAEGWNKRAAVHLAIGNFAQAALDYKRVLELEPRHFGAIADMGTLLFIEGDEAGALKAFESALELHPQSIEIRARAERVRKKLYPPPF